MSISDTAARRQHHYSIFGLELVSDLALPELRPVAPSGQDADIVITIGAVADEERAPGLHKIAGGTLLNVEKIARFAVSRGARIFVEPHPGAPLANIRLFLLGSAMGMLIHQRGLLPLHGNAIEIDGKAVAFVGPSGAGKSTLAAWFHDRGCRILSDDVCVVRFDAAGNPLLHAGIPRLRLWREAIEASGRNVATFARSYAGDETYDKYDVPIDASHTISGSLPLAAVYSLNRGSDFKVEHLGAVGGAEAIFANTYRGEYLDLVGTSLSHWEACIRLIKRVPVFALSRPWSLESMGEHVTAMIQHACAEAGRSSNLDASV